MADQRPIRLRFRRRRGELRVGKRFYKCLYKRIRPSAGLESADGSVSVRPYDAKIDLSGMQKATGKSAGKAEVSRRKTAILLGTRLVLVIVFGTCNTIVQGMSYKAYRLLT